MGGGGKRYGLYRSGSQLDSFFGACNIELRIGASSRVPTVRECLTDLNRRSDRASLTRILEAAVDPRDYTQDKTKHAEALEYINSKFGPDGFELREREGRYRLESMSTSPAMLSAVEQHATVLN